MLNNITNKLFEIFFIFSLFLYLFNKFIFKKKLFFVCRKKRVCQFAASYVAATRLPLNAPVAATFERQKHLLAKSELRLAVALCRSHTASKLEACGNLSVRYFCSYFFLFKLSLGPFVFIKLDKLIVKHCIAATG